MAEQTLEQEPTIFPPSTTPNTDQQQQQQQQQPTKSSSMLVLRIMSKRRTWVCLFVGVYAVLLSLSWNFLKSVLSWYESTLINSSTTSTSSVYSGWPALYASVLLGVAFGVLSMVAALAVAVPATLVTWITVLVLLTFCGKPRRALVMEGKKLTTDITGFVVKVLIKEGNIVAALCAVLGYFAFIRKSKGNSSNGFTDDY